MKHVKGHYHDRALEFEGRHDSVVIRTEAGDFCITQSAERGLEINFAGRLSRQYLAVKPRSANVVWVNPADH